MRKIAQDLYRHMRNPLSLQNHHYCYAKGRDYNRMFCSSEKEMEDLSWHMSYSYSTSELYYRVRKGGRESLEAFKNIQTLSCKCKVYNVNKINIFPCRSTTNSFT